MDKMNKKKKKSKYLSKRNYSIPKDIAAFVIISAIASVVILNFD